MCYFDKEQNCFRYENNEEKTLVQIEETNDYIANMKYEDVQELVKTYILKLTNK